tara:strand:- start:448 stop:1293 length:846 start_codon:yes stop_codon:yes gene_type:complete
MITKNIDIIDFKDHNAPIYFTNSLKNTGFAVIKNHPIENQLVQDVYIEWDLFFKSDEKHNYHFDIEKQDGFFPFGSENAKDHNLKDLKEYFHIYPGGSYPKNKSQKTTFLYNNLCELSNQLLLWVEENIPMKIKNNLSVPLAEMVKESQRNLLRIIHYPPMRDTDLPGQYRAAAHEDINLLTILCSATTPGLQAKHLNGEWIDVPCDPKFIIVNTGDMLQMATEGYFPSTTHRVINPKSNENNKSRLSMPLFLHPHDHVVLSKNYTAGEYLEKRLHEIGLK